MKNYEKNFSGCARKLLKKPKFLLQNRFLELNGLKNEAKIDSQSSVAGKIASNSLLDRFLLDLGASLGPKNKHFAWEVLQKWVMTKNLLLNVMLQNVCDQLAPFGPFLDPFWSIIRTQKTQFCMGGPAKTRFGHILTLRSLADNIFDTNLMILTKF